MRIVYTKDLKSDMTLARSIYDQNFRLLLKEGLVFNDRIIEIVKNKNVPFVLINDSLSEGVEPNFLVSDKLRFQLLGFYETEVEKVLKVIPKTLRTLIERSKFAANKSLAKSFDFKRVYGFVEDLINEIQSYAYDKRFYSYVRMDRSFYQMSIETCIISLLIGMKLDYKQSELLHVGVSALLADIGLIFSPQFNIKTGIYTGEIEPYHTNAGYSFLREARDLTAIDYIPSFEHHEYRNGTGYPMKKDSDNSCPDRNRNEKENQIFRFSEIVCVALYFLEACKSDSVKKVMIQMQNEDEKLFNTHLLSHMKEVVNPYPPGFPVLLKGKTDSVYKEGIILGNQPPGFHPLIQLLSNERVPPEELGRYEINVF